MKQNRHHKHQNIDAGRDSETCRETLGGPEAQVKNIHSIVQDEFVSSSGLEKCVSALVNGCRQNENITIHHNKYELVINVLMLDLFQLLMLTVDYCDVSF